MGCGVNLGGGWTIGTNFLNYVVKFDKFFILALNIFHQTIELHFSFQMFLKPCHYFCVLRSIEHIPCFLHMINFANEFVEVISWN